MPNTPLTRLDAFAPLDNRCSRCGSKNPFVNSACGQCGTALSRRPTTAAPSLPTYPVPSSQPSAAPSNETEEVWENYWHRTTGSHSAPPLTASASFPNITATTLPPAAVPLPGLDLVPARRTNNSWKLAALVVVALGGGIGAGRFLIASRNSTAPTSSAINDWRPVEVAPSEFRPPRITPANRANEIKRQQRAFWRGYNSRPDLTAGSPPSIYVRAMRNLRSWQRRTFRSSEA